MHARNSLAYSPYPASLKHPPSSSQSSELDSLAELADSRPEFRGPTPESKEVVFLKEKLIEIHNKLLKELDNNNKLTERLATYDKELRTAQRVIEQLQNQVANCENELEEANQLVALRGEKTEEKYRSAENRLHEEARRNHELKSEIEGARSKMMECMMQKTGLEERIGDLQAQLKSGKDAAEELNDKLRYKTDLLFSKDGEIGSLGKKVAQLDKQLDDRAAQISELENSLYSRKEVEEELQHLLKL
jgi:chromosome segregation ATPase